MNVDIKKGCFYRITVQFNDNKDNRFSIVAEGLTLEQMEDTIIEKLEDELYSIAHFAVDNGQGTIVPSHVHIEPRYYYFMQRAGDDDRYPVQRTSVSMYGPYQTKKPGPHFYIPKDVLSLRLSFDNFNIPCEDRDQFDDIYFGKLFEKVNEQLKDKFNEKLQELYVTDSDKMASTIKRALGQYNVSDDVRNGLNKILEKLQ